MGFKHIARVVRTNGSDNNTHKTSPQLSYSLTN